MCRLHFLNFASTAGSSVTNGGGDAWNASENHALVEPVSARFPIPLLTESLEGLWIQLSSQESQAKQPMQAMPFPCLN